MFGSSTHRHCMFVTFIFQFLVTFRDLTLVLTFSGMTFVLMQYLSQTFASTLCEFELYAARLTDPTYSLKCENSVFTFDLTLTLHVTFILKCETCIRCVSTCTFERRLACLATALSFRDDLGEGVKNAPPSQGCLVETPFNAALNGGSRERGGRGNENYYAKSRSKYPYSHVLRQSVTTDARAPFVTL